MTTIVERSIVINATPDKIDAVTLDGSRLPEWYTGLERVNAENLEKSLNSLKTLVEGDNG